MSKKKNKPHTKSNSPTIKVVKDKSILGLPDLRKQKIFLAALCLIFYVNTFFSHYALDDGIVVKENEFVHKGFAGIKDIMTHDAFFSFYNKMGSQGELSGGRYRPLSIVTFAMEYQFFGPATGDKITWENIPNKHGTGQIKEIKGDNVLIKYDDKPNPVRESLMDVLETCTLPAASHVVNVLLYALSIFLLLQFLTNHLFKNLENGCALAFLTTLIFAIHPIHTEVVANIKSRDEIMSFLFIVLTFQSVFQYYDTKKTKHIVSGMVLYFLALLSKEWGITLLALLPMSLYIFRKEGVWKSVIATVPYILIAIVYMSMRYAITGKGRTDEITEVLNNPYVYASTQEKFATKIFVLFNYLKLMFVPHPLSADYSYNTIPYRNFSNAGVLFSFAVHAFLTVYGFIKLRQRHILGFAIFFYLFHLFLVSNFVFDIGATMGERLVYHSSFGFAMAAAFWFLEGMKKLQFASMRKNLTYGIFGLLIILAGTKTLSRNKNWYDDNSLFRNDCEIVPNSCMANANAGKGYIALAVDTTISKNERDSCLNTAIEKLNKAVAVHPKFVNGYFNLGFAYFIKGDYDKTEYNWNMARKYFPTHPDFKRKYDPSLAQIFLNKGLEIGKNNNPAEGIILMERGLKYGPDNVDLLYNLGGANYTVKNYTKAKEYFERTLQLNPDFTDAKNGLAATMQVLGVVNQ